MKITNSFPMKRLLYICSSGIGYVFCPFILLLCIEVAYEYIISGISGESLPYKVSDHNKVTCTSCNYTKEAWVDDDIYSRIYINKQNSLNANNIYSYKKLFKVSCSWVCLNGWEINATFIPRVQQYSCVDNMRSDGQLLTSGYTSYQNINKPIGKTARQQKKIV